MLPPQLEGWETTQIVISSPGARSRPLLVAVADEPAERAQGLMNVTDLAGIEGMLFVFADDVGDGFWMKDTLLPLDIAFFAGDGVIVDVLTMTPCAADPCPTYRPDGEYRFAVEVEAGDFDQLRGDEILMIDE